MGSTTVFTSGEQEDEQSPLLPDHLSRSASNDKLLGTTVTVNGYGTSVSDNGGQSPTDIERGPSDEAASHDAIDRKRILKIALILVIGMFTGNADGSLVLATHPRIASEFNDLEDSSWLFTAFTLAGAATQTLFAKLSDIYGRRAVLAVSYLLFALGCFLVGIGQSMWQVVLGRVISGSGGTAIGVVSSVLITDLLPLREVATWQAGINLVSTIGRSIGGPLGGWLADTIGWRWSFLGQAPIFLLGLVLCLIYIPGNVKPSRHPAAVSAAADLAPGVPSTDKGKEKNNLGRIDWLGAILLALCILSLLTPIQIGGIKVPWAHPLIFVLFGAAGILGAAFAITETRWAREPIFPLALLRRSEVVISYIATGCIGAAQVSLMFTVPVYFQITERTSNTVAGAHLLPAVIGNAIGGILAGVLIKRTGRYKYLTVFGSTCSFLAYFLLLLRWHGHTNFWESLYIAPGGFGVGVVTSAMFINLQNVVKPKDKASATSGFYLSMSTGIILGLASVSAVMVETMKWDLNARLGEMGLSPALRAEIIKKAVSNIDYIDHAKPYISKAVVAAYIKGLSWTHGVSLICSVVSAVSALCLREHKL